VTDPSLTVLGAAQAVQENAQNLGLQWQIRPGTVSSVTENGPVNVFVDGDNNVATPAISLIGAVSASARVWVLQVPPSGNYIIGTGYLDGQVSSGVGLTGVSTGSTTYAVTLTSLGRAFVAPASGKVIVHLRSSIAPAAGPATAWMSVRIGEGSVIGSGTVFQAASDNYALMLGVTGSADVGTSFEVSGLTPGAVYNAQLQHRTSAGTSFWSRREVIISPS
jgi:hypothetical protein